MNNSHCTLLFAHFFCCELLNIMPRLDLVGAICQNSDSGGGDEDGLKFIRLVGGLHPKIHEVWTFGDEGITLEFHNTARVGVSASGGDYFATK